MMHLLFLFQEVDYDPARNAAYWSLRPVLVLSRTLEIGNHACSSVLPICSASASECIPCTTEGGCEFYEAIE